jgi:hypothetical protein
MSGFGVPNMNCGSELRSRITEEMAGRTQVNVAKLAQEQPKKRIRIIRI